MNTRNTCYSVQRCHYPSSFAGLRGALMLVIPFVMGLSLTGVTQAPMAPSSSRQSDFPPRLTTGKPRSALPNTAVALRKAMQHSPASTNSSQSSTPTEKIAAVTPGSVQYSYAYINFPNAAFSQPNAINDAGEVVGYYDDSGYNAHAFIWRNGTLQDVDYPGAMQTSFSGINNLSQIVGEYIDSSFVVHATLYSQASATWSDLPVIPGGWQIYIGSSISINDEGEVFGCAGSDTFPTVLTWIWHPAIQAYSYLTAAAAGPGETCGESMNDLQTAVGTLNTAYGNGATPVLFVGDRLTGYQIAPLPSSIAQDTLVAPFGLNNRGTVAGTVYSSSDNSASGFLRDRDGVFTIVNDAAWPQTYLTGVNDFGILIGDVYDPATGLNPGLIAYPQGSSALAAHPQ